MNPRLIVLVIAVIAATLAACLFRYELVAVAVGGQGEAGFAYLLDRWTGEVKVVFQDKIKSVKAQP